MYATLLSNRTGTKYGTVKSRIKTLPPPIGGWNTRDPLSSMDEADAITLQNLVPSANKVVARFGYEAWVTGIGTFVESLMTYAPPNTGSAHLFAASPTDIYDVTSEGVVGAAVVSSLLNGRWQHVNFATAGGTFLWICNGADNPRYYNGSAWTTLVGGTDITGSGMTAPVAASFVSVCSHQNRLWLIPENSQDVWYLGVQAITGAALKLPLGALLTRGGKILAMGSWTKDGGAGMDDCAVFVSSAGEVLVFEGIDPGSAATWSLAGRFTIPDPVGRRCLIKAGGDLAIITAAGVELVSQLLPAGGAQQRGIAVTDKIQGSFNAAYRQCGTSHGWQIIEYPRDQLLFVNIPLSERVMSEQYVANMATGAWCRFTGLDAGVWAMLGDRLFFGHHDGTICRYSADADGYTDDGDPIAASYQSAYSQFKSPLIKMVSGARPVMIAAVGYTPRLQVLNDYDTRPLNLAAAPATSVAGAEWDVAEWDIALWGATSVVRRKWQTVHGDGVALSVALVTSIAEEFVLNQIDILYEQGSGIA